MPPNPRIPEPSITSKLLGSGTGVGGTAFGGTANANPVIRSETKPESKVETSDLTAKSGSPGHAPLKLKSKPVPLEVLARLDGAATGKPWLGFHSFAVLSGKATEYGIEPAMAGAASSRHNSVSHDRQATFAFMFVLPINGGLDRRTAIKKRVVPPQTQNSQ